MTTPTRAADVETAREIAYGLEYISSKSWDSSDRVDLRDLSDKIVRALAAVRAEARRETVEACCRAECRACNEGYRATETSPGQWAHLADLQPAGLPKFYFDSQCYAAAIRAAFAESESEK